MIKCLKRFDNIQEYLNFTDILVDINWIIDNGYLKDRAKIYDKLIFFKNLKTEYIKKNISFFELKDEEVITWMDTLLILRKVIKEMYKIDTFLKDFTILMEYPFIFGNFMRSDYILIFDEYMIILEFGMFNQDEKRKEERYTKKVQENIGHRNILQNMISSKIFTYVLMYRPEFDVKTNKIIEDNKNYNKAMIDKLSMFINILIDKSNKEKAITQLEEIEKFR